MNRLINIMMYASCLIASFSSQANDFNTTIPIHDKGAVAYYVAGHVNGFGDTEFMVDTGSGYTAINDNMLKQLSKETHIEFLTTVSAVLANGGRTSLSVYKIASINIGGKCVIHDVKAFILPGSTRNILGLSALKKAAPFAFSTNPPSLLLSNCEFDVS